MSAGSLGSATDDKRLELCTPVKLFILLFKYKHKYRVEMIFISPVLFARIWYVDSLT